MKAKLLSAGRLLVLPFSGVVLCHGLALGFTEILARQTAPPGPAATLVLLGLGFLALLLPLSLSLLALYHSLRLQPRSQAVAIVLGGYIAVLLAFTSLYYLFVFVGDFVDTRESNSYYYAEAELLRRQPGFRAPRYRSVSERAFSGVSPRLWNGVEQRYGPFEDPRGGPPGIDTILQHTISLEAPFDYQRQNRLAVWFDCLHFSTVTIATLGYGDIVPTKWYSKLAADLQVLMGIIFVSLSLGRILAGGESDA